MCIYIYTCIYIYIYPRRQLRSLTWSWTKGKFNQVKLRIWEMLSLTNAHLGSKLQDVATFRWRKPCGTVRVPEQLLSFSLSLGWSWRLLLQGLQRFGHGANRNGNPNGAHHHFANFALLFHHVVHYCSIDIPIVAIWFFHPAPMLCGSRWKRLRFSFSKY